MSKEAREKRPAASPAVMEKMKELAELISQEQFASSGVPLEITFSEIEEIGHQAGQLIAAQVDRQLVTKHRDHFADEQACPTCERPCASRPCERELTTRDGTMTLPETICYCPNCRRSFFPSACSAES